MSAAVGGVVLLRGIDAEVGAGEIVGLVGPNGSGKSTLAKVISGFLRPSEGEILLDGVPIGGLPAHEVARRGIRRHFQSPHLAWNLTAQENVAAAADLPRRASWLKTLSAPRMEARAGAIAMDTALRLLERVGLTGQLDTPARDLSYGQQRLLGLAVVLAFPSRVLVLDEPFAGLKPELRTGAAKIIDSERAQRATIVIEHDLQTLSTLVGRTWLMHGGELDSFQSLDIARHSNGFVRSTRIPSAELSCPVSRVAEANRNPQQLVAWRRTKSSTTLEKPQLCLKQIEGGYATQIVIRGVDLELSGGDVVVLLGANGSGKSTLLRMIAGIAQLTAGQIQMDGCQIQDLRPDERARLGLRFLPQDQRVFRDLTVQENLLTTRDGLRITHSHLTLSGSESLRDSIPANGRDELDRLLHEFGGRTAGLLSGGEQTRLALEALNVGKARVLLLDEPSSGIDARAADVLRQRILGWRAQNALVLLAEHNLEFALSVATRMLLLQDGRLHEEC